MKDRLDVRLVNASCFNIKEGNSILINIKEPLSGAELSRLSVVLKKSFKGVHFVVLNGADVFVGEEVKR